LSSSVKPIFFPAKAGLVANKAVWVRKSKTVIPTPSLEVSVIGILVPSEAII